MSSGAAHPGQTVFLALLRQDLRLKLLSSESKIKQRILNMIETREYPVPLTDEELKTTADFVGLIHKSIQDRENAFAEVRQEYKAAIKELRSGLAMQLEKLSTRREIREVELEIVFNSPEKGMKQIYLNSTGQLIDTLEMTEDDEQDLFAGTEEKEPEPEQICDKCGAVASGNRVLKLDRDRNLCLICTARANDKKWAAVMAWHKAGHQVLFRACFYRGVTKFTFMGAGHSWGQPMYKEGDYQDDGTPAADFYKTLQELNNFKED